MVLATSVKHAENFLDVAHGMLFNLLVSLQKRPLRLHSLFVAVIFCYRNLTTALKSLFVKISPRKIENYLYACILQALMSKAFFRKHI